MNLWTGIGRLTKDPELKKTKSDISVCSFTIAIDRPRKENGEKKTDFIDCSAWRGTAELIAKYFSKGRMICVKGSIEPYVWEDKENKKHHSFKINVDGCYFCGDKNNSDSSSATTEKGDIDADPNFFSTAADDDLPF